MPSILFVHEYFPAQFGGLARFLAEQGWKVVFASAREEYNLGADYDVDNFNKVEYRSGTSLRNGHPYLALTERALRNGQGFAKTANALSKSGFSPDIIFTHSGWGSGLFAKGLWPKAKLVQYLEWWSNYPPAYDEPHAKTTSTQEDHARTLLNNLPFLLDFQASDLVIAPTEFQADQAPNFVKPRIAVQYDGVDCDVFRPRAPGEVMFETKGLPPDAPLVTFAARSLEPIRGFYDCVAALEILMKRHPDVHFAIAGEDRARYGARMKRGQGHKRNMLRRYKLDRSRLHFLGRMNQKDYIGLLRRSSVHLYLSYPFIPSRSLYEAMASACPLVASDIALVREALGPDAPALLVQPGNVSEIAASVSTLLQHSDLAVDMGIEARARALSAFGTNVCHPRLARLLTDLNDGPITDVIAAQ